MLKIRLAPLKKPLLMNKKINVTQYQTKTYESRI